MSSSFIIIYEACGSSSELDWENYKHFIQRNTFKTTQTHDMHSLNIIMSKLQQLEWKELRLNISKYIILWCVRYTARKWGMIKRIKFDLSLSTGMFFLWHKEGACLVIVNIMSPTVPVSCDVNWQPISLLQYHGKWSVWQNK